MRPHINALCDLLEVLLSSFKRTGLFEVLIFIGAWQLRSPGPALIILSPSPQHSGILQHLLLWLGIRRFKGGKADVVGETADTAWNSDMLDCDIAHFKGQRAPGANINGVYHSLFVLVAEFLLPYLVSRAPWTKDRLRDWQFIPGQVHRQGLQLDSKPPRSHPLK